MPPHPATAAAAASGGGGAQSCLLNLHDLVPTLKPEAAGVDAAARRQLWLEVRQSLLSLRDTITSEWELHRSRPHDLDFTRIDTEMLRARKDAADSIFNMDKFLLTAARIVASLKRLASKGAPVKRPAADPAPSSPEVEQEEEVCGLKKARRELDELKGARDKLLQELTALAGKKKRLEEEFVKVREEMRVTKLELAETGY